MALGLSLTPKKQISYQELVTSAKLNLVAWLTGALTGAASTAQIEDRAVTAAKAENFGAWFEGTDIGTANAHAVAVASGLANPVQGTLLCYKANATNTSGTVTLDVTATPGATAPDDAWTQRQIREFAGVDLLPGRIRAGQYIVLRYDLANTYWQLLSTSPEPPTRYALSTNVGNAYTLTFGTTSGYAAGATLAALSGKLIFWKVNAANTGNVTLAVDGFTAKSVKRDDGTEIASGLFLADMIVGVIYDATLDYYVVITPLPTTTRATVPVRQTVLASQVDTNGHPNFLSNVGQKISLAASAGSPFVAAFAAGFDAYGAVDYILRLTANAADAWDLPTADGTYYLFIDRAAADGTITYGYTTTRPTYVDDDAASISSGAHTFLKNEMQMYLGDGASAAVKQRVFVGESVVSGSAITSVTSYVLRGRFQSSADQTITANNTDQTWSETHKLGLAPRRAEWVLVCISDDVNYSAGDEVPAMCLNHTNTNFIKYALVSRSTLTGCDLIAPWGTMGVTAGLPNPSTYAVNANAITAAKWKLRCYAERGW